MALFDFIFLIFLILKLTGTVAWSWWWVTSPIWGGVLIYLIIRACFQSWDD